MSKEGNVLTFEFAFDSVLRVHERRVRTRYPIQGPVHFTWLSEAGQRARGVGTTRDISASGAFIESQSVPPRDTAVTVSAGLRSGASDCLQTRLVGEGTVCRPEANEEGGKGFAVAVTFRTDGHSSR